MPHDRLSSDEGGGMKTFAQRNTAATSRDDWETPPEFFARLDGEFRFTLDAAASPVNAKCVRYFTKADDGLSQDWGSETVWINPPYGKTVTPKWIRKAYTASLAGATVVCLVPSRTDAAWFHEYATNAEVRFVKGRLRSAPRWVGA
jgi:phage N-6-adenine-methyltransferase